MTTPEPQPQPRRPFRAPHWVGYIVVGVAAFIFGAAVQGNGGCTGLDAAPAHVVTVAA